MLASFRPCRIARTSREFKNNTCYFFPQLNSVQEAELERLEAARPRRPGSRERGPVLRMARLQPPPWVHAAFLLCCLGLGRAIEIPMDREFAQSSFIFLIWGSRVGGQGRVKTSFQRRFREGKQ